MNPPVNAEKPRREIDGAFLCIRVNLVSLMNLGGVDRGNFYLDRVKIFDTH